jgi:electron transport complex protein RnfD
LGAFFIITDPVSSPNTPAGIITYGLLIGLLTFLIRGFGAYPDGLAFAVLLANACGPLLDHTARHWQKTRRAL